MGMVSHDAPALIIGAGGLLGTALTTALMADGRGVLRMGRNDLDLSHPDDIIRRIALLKPARIFNCAAHTDLEAAESAPALDWAVNAELPGVIARACAQLRIPLVHFSSTGCYGDWKSEPYTEVDGLRPLSRHHQAKYAGEQAVALAGCAHTIFRLGWLYGGDSGQPKNFVWKRILEARDKPEMVSDDVQRGCPTYVDDVARQVLLATDRGLEGIYNAVAGGAASRCQYVRAIVAAAGLPCRVDAGPSFARKAPVSKNETAVNASLQAAGLDIMPPWQQSLRDYVVILMRENNLP